MENYRKQVKARILINSILIAVTLGLIVVNRFIIKIDTTNFTSGVAGMLTGASILASIRLIHLKKIVADDRKLKEEYNKENDERLRAIRSKAGFPILFFTSCAIILVGYALINWNETVAATLIVIGGVQLVIMGLIKLVLTKIM
ncbi:MAG: hypothetical protein GX219_02730 [Tissierellia bacterium]|nr:hypothetical protein [Tissierellia bacterium]